jgi:SulP family sulfate permease
MPASFALAAGSALEGVAAAVRPGALFLLTVIAGCVMIAAGLLRLGHYARFVSHSVMIGFLTEVSVNIVCGQLADVGLASTRWSTVSALVALVVPTVVVTLVGADVLRVEDVGDIPRGMSLPAPPTSVSSRSICSPVHSR